MRTALLCLGLLSASCFDPAAPVGLGCSESGACPPGQLCVDSTCVELACSELCGDVDQDGDVDDDDATRLDDINDGDVDAEPCASVYGDIDGDADIDEGDEDALDLVIAELVTSTCQPCPSSCADLDGSGTLDTADREALAGLLMSSRLPTVCELAIADVDGSRIIDEVDLQLIPALIDGLARDGCNRCDQTCGDVARNGRVELLDVSAARDIALGNTLPDLCSFAAADINADDVVDQRDVGIIDSIAKNQTNRDCQRCTGVCGDFDQDGDVDPTDATEIRQLLGTFQGIPSPCGMDSGDVDGDFVLEIEDAEAIEDGEALSCAPTTDAGG